MRHLQLLTLVAVVVISVAVADGFARQARAVVSGTTELVSVDSAGNQTVGGSSEFPSISDDGRFVAFYSHATNLVPGDTNGADDIFVRDRQSSVTSRISVDSSGGQANGSAVYNGLYPTISGDGRLVVFNSDATNLVQGDTNGTSDVFVHDRLSGETSRVSIGNTGSQGNSSSYAIREAISADGRFVAFESAATNLVPGDTSTGWDVFVRDRQSGTTERVSVDSAGNQADASSASERINADGRFVAFVSWATNLVPGDTNGVLDVFVHDRQTGDTERVSVDSAGGQGNGRADEEPWISADGRFVAFGSYATNLVPDDTNGVLDVFVHDRQTGATERVSVASDETQGNGYYIYPFPSLSADGRYVTFSSDATNLVAGDTNGKYDVFLRDRQAGVTERLNLDSAGNEANHYSANAVISADGRFAAFPSLATNLVPGDTNGLDDVFVRDRCPDGSCVAPPPPPPPPMRHRKVIVLGGLDSSARCGGTDDGLDGMIKSISSYVATTESSQLSEYPISTADFVQFSWSGRYCADGAADYSASDTCIGVAEGAARLDALIASLPAGTTIDIIGHSLGGVTAAYWASVKSESYLAGSVHSIITLDSPLLGANLRGPVWQHLIIDSVCEKPGADHTSIEDIRKKSGIIEFVKKSRVTGRESFVSVICTPAGDSLDGSWKVFTPHATDHSCGWKRRDSLGYIALSLLETLIDDRSQAGSLEPAASYFSGWITASGGVSVRGSLHSTRSVGRRITTSFDGGEIVLLYEGTGKERTGPFIQISLDGRSVFNGQLPVCGRWLRCRLPIASGLPSASHTLRIGVISEARSMFNFDGLAVCPTTVSDQELNIEGFKCGQ